MMRHRHCAFARVEMLDGEEKTAGVEQPRVVEEKALVATAADRAGKGSGLRQKRNGYDNAKKAKRSHKNSSVTELLLKRNDKMIYRQNN
jgi:hypothetical protein